ncbi:LlaJI family restriction endonuclease [Corynebacterium tuberculostearicum]|uniref:LlaJI family restriction endonuclease n=1 Tax=Corynebacterium tuberculostearicum TaxID=38304 RepID=UPI00265D19BE|nr:LlaJI family restriction endonuclease [Corynebacterium tuberculostearicum]WKE55769.1 LlaJI family restriction endonuclease [Corynebacterium tuberculostearicum]
MSYSLPVWVRENSTYPLSQFVERGISPEEIDKVSQIPFAPLSFGPNGTVIVDFVGATSIAGVPIYSLPKFVPAIETAHGVEILRTTINAIAKASTHSVHSLDSDSHPNDLEEQTSWLRTARNLVEDFIAHGRYVSQRAVHVSHGEGEIDWEETIWQSPVVLQKGRPIYTSPIRIDYRVHADTDIARIHIAVIAELVSYLDSMDPLGVIDIARVPIHSDRDLSDFGDIADLLHIIRAERQQQFEDRKLRVLDLLESYISFRFDSHATSYSTLVGTTHFEIVWETMCAAYFQDRFRTLQGGLRPPLWEYRHKQSTVCVDAAKSLIPDIVMVEGSDLYVLDAKYYVPRYAASSISAQPGTMDIAKQYMYVPGVEEKWPGKTVRGNAFVLPSTDLIAAPIRSRGRVTLPFLEASHYLPITLLEMNPLLLARNFLGDKTLPAGAIRRFFAPAGAGEQSLGLG